MIALFEKQTEVIIYWKPSPSLKLINLNLAWVSGLIVCKREQESSVEWIKSSFEQHEGG